MKLWEIHALAKRWEMFSTLRTIYRIDDTIFYLEFDHKCGYLCDLARGTSHIYPHLSPTSVKRYASPLDQTLSKRCNNTKILAVEQIAHDRIIRLTLSSSLGYKSQTTILQFELTGRHVNLIVTDENLTILEAMRHIDPQMSSRTIQIGEKLSLPPAPPYTTDLTPQCDDIDTFLQTQATLILSTRLETDKRQKIDMIEKKMALLQERLDLLPSQEELRQSIQDATDTGHLLLAHLGDLKIYSPSVTLCNFEGDPVTITIPSVKTVAMIPEYYFRKAKKMRQKERNTPIERDNLHDKILFLQRLKHHTRVAPDQGALAILFPPKMGRQKEEKGHEWETFMVEGYKIFVGKNQAGNSELLKRAKASDFWFHLKDRPSTHVIVPTAKTSLPEKVLTYAAQLCVSFSVDHAGWYEVDYTQRRHVKPKEKANCLYVNYKTIKVEKI